MNNARERGAGAPIGRRGALQWLIRGFLSLWGLGTAALGISFLKAPSPENRPGEGQLRCGTLSSLPIGRARFVRHGADPLFVVRISGSEVMALSAICSHLRCVLEWNDETGTILCPCHAGAFDREGNVLSGPPNRPLTRYPAQVRGDEIVVHI